MRLPINFKHYVYKMFMPAGRTVVCDYDAMLIQLSAFRFTMKYALVRDYTAGQICAKNFNSLP